MSYLFRFTVFNFIVPPRWIIEPNDGFVILQGSVSIDCLTTGTPEPEVTWQKAIGEIYTSYTWDLYKL